MAVYKVPQDVEADDKLIGPLSFKQFTFALITIGFVWMSWQMFKIQPFLVIIPLPFVLAFGILATPLRKDQPTDVYVAALINFWMRPKLRLWNQEGMLEHVVVTAPKKPEVLARKRLSQGEIHSRLTNLARMMDTRGWSSKNVAVEDVQGVEAYDWQDSDRIAAPIIVAPPVEELGSIKPEDDVLDEDSTLARNFQRLEDNLVQRIAAQQAQQQTATTVSPELPSTATAVAEPPLAPAIQVPGVTYQPGQQPAPVYAEPSANNEPLVIPTARAYPEEIHQTVIQPLRDEQQAVVESVPPVTDHSADVIVDGNQSSVAKDDEAKAFEEGGEVSLR